MNIKEFLFKNSGIRQTIIKNTFWLTAAEIFARLSGLFIVIYLTHVLGPYEYGKFTFALSFALLLSAFSDLGVVEISTREFSRSADNEERFNSVFTLELILCTMTFVIAVITSFFITQDASIREIIWVAMLFVLSNNIFGIFFSFLRARQRMEYEAAVKVFQAIVSLGLVLVILFSFPSALFVSYAYFASSFLVFLLFFIFFNIRFKKVALDFKSNFFKTLHISWPLSFGLMPGWIYISLNAVILGYFNLITENGWYGAAMRVAVAAMILANLVSRSFYPALSNLFATAKHKLAEGWNHLTEGMVFLVIPVVIGGITLAPRIIQTFYGPAFSPAVLALQLLIVVVGISFMLYPYTLLLVIADYQRHYFAILAFGALANVSLNLLLLPSYGLYGSITSTIISCLLVFGLTVVVAYQKKVLVPIHARFFKTLGISFAAGLAMYGLLQIPNIGLANVFLACGIAGICYLTIFFLLYRIFFPNQFILKRYQ